MGIDLGFGGASVFFVCKYKIYPYNANYTFSQYYSSTGVAGLERDF